MVSTHYRWDKCGRTFISDTGSFVFKSFAGQQNIDLGNGDYAPYLKDEINKTFKTGRLEVRILIDGIQFYIEDKKSIKLSFNPEIEKGVTWERKPSTVSNLRIREEETDGATNHLYVSYDIDTDDQKSTIELQLGRSNKIQLSYEIKAKVAGKQRLTCDLSKEPKKVSDVKYEFPDKSWLSWFEYEIADHKIEGSKLHLKEKQYEKGRIEKLKPDTWGYTDVDSDADLNITDDTWDPNTGANQIWAGKPDDNDEWNLGLRFVNVTVPKDATINSAYIRLARDSGGAPIYWKIRGVDEDDTAAFTNIDNWTDRDPTTAAVDWDIDPLWGWGVLTASPDIKTIIAEITTRAGWASGQAMGIWVDDDGCAGWDGIKCFDEQQANFEPDMQIDYTAVVGWTGKVIGVTNPTKVLGVSDIAKVIGV